MSRYCRLDFWVVYRENAADSVLKKLKPVAAVKNTVKYASLYGVRIFLVQDGMGFPVNRADGVVG